MPESERILHKMQRHYLGRQVFRALEHTHKDNQGVWRDDKDYPWYKRVMASAPRDRSVVEEMYLILKSYAQSMVRNKFPQYVNDKELLRRHSHGAAWFLVDHYFKDPNWSIEESFAGYLKHTIKQSVYDPPEIPEKKQAFSLDQISLQTKRSYTVASDTDTIYEVENDIDKVRARDHVSDFLCEAVDYVEDHYNRFCLLVALRCFLLYGERRVDGLFQKNYRAARIEFNQTTDMLRTELLRLERGD